MSSSKGGYLSLHHLASRLTSEEYRFSSLNLVNSNCLRPEASCRCLLNFAFLLRLSLSPLLLFHESPFTFVPVCFISERCMPLTLSLSFSFWNTNSLYRGAPLSPHATKHLITSERIISLCNTCGLAPIQFNFHYRSFHQG